jgi:hypothetical protein
MPADTFHFLALLERRDRSGNFRLTVTLRTNAQRLISVSGVESRIKKTSAAPVAAGRMVYFVSDAGVTRVVRAGAKFELIAEMLSASAVMPLQP